MGYEPQQDFGTPEVLADIQVSLTFHGRAVTVPAGTSVMRAGALAEASIPKLCGSDNRAALSPIVAAATQRLETSMSKTT